MLKLLTSQKHRSDNPKSPIRNLQSAIGRREWIRRSSMAAAAAALHPALQNRARPGAGDYKTYFGDLHNHNAVGYAQGSLERTFEIARNHLDFFAFTPHGHWHDIGHYENNIEERWIKGFAVTRARWREVVEMARKFDQDRGEQVSWYYLRVVEANGQIAWSSPIWVEARRRP